MPKYYTPKRPTFAFANSGSAMHPLGAQTVEKTALFTSDRQETPAELGGVIRYRQDNRKSLVSHMFPPAELNDSSYQQTAAPGVKTIIVNGTALESRNATFKLKAATGDYFVDAASVEFWSNAAARVWFPSPPVSDAGWGILRAYNSTGKLYTEVPILLFWA